MKPIRIALFCSTLNLFNENFSKKALNGQTIKAKTTNELTKRSVMKVIEKTKRLQKTSQKILNKSVDVVTKHYIPFCIVS